MATFTLVCEQISEFHNLARLAHEGNIRDSIIVLAVEMVSQVYECHEGALWVCTIFFCLVEME